MVRGPCLFALSRRLVVPGKTAKESARGNCNK